MTGVVRLITTHAVQSRTICLMVFYLDPVCEVPSAMNSDIVNSSRDYALGIFGKRALFFTAIETQKYFSPVYFFTYF